MSRTDGILAFIMLPSLTADSFTKTTPPRTRSCRATRRPQEISLDDVSAQGKFEPRAISFEGKSVKGCCS